MVLPLPDPLAKARDGGRLCDAGMAGREWRRRVVLHRKLDFLRRLRPEQLSHHVEPEIDAGRDPAGGDEIAVDDDPAVIEDRAESRSSSRDAQWVVARLPASKPAAPSRNAPVQTELTRRDRWAMDLIASTTTASPRCSNAPGPPGTQSTSSARHSSKRVSGRSSIPT